MTQPFHLSALARARAGLLLAAMAAACSTQAATQSYTTPGPHSWTVPGGVTQIDVAATGGGGGGGGGTSGGPGGAVAVNSWAVTSGTVSIVVGGGGGAGSTGNGGGGGVASSLNQGGNWIVAGGGGGGSGRANQSPGLGNGGHGCGGNGAPGGIQPENTGVGGQGGNGGVGGSGGAAGTDGGVSGTNGSASSGGAGASPGGGAGGSGWGGGGGGGTGTSYDGGGGGGGSTTSGTCDSATNAGESGAAGGNGSVTITYTIPTYTITASVSPAGGGTWGSCPATVNHGDSPTCTVTAAPGHALVGITGCDSVSGGACTLSDVQGNRSIVAQFGPIAAQPVPTLGEWGMALLGALLGLFGLRRRAWAR